MAGISFSQAEIIIGLLRELRDDQRKLLALGAAPTAPRDAGFCCPLCGAADCRRLVGADGSKTWRCDHCNSSGHLPADATV